MSILSKIPNALTISRMVATVIMVLYYYFNLPSKFEVLFFLFTLSSISDFFDGYLSRKWKVVSNFGKCLDPISDKLLIIIALLILVDSKGINIIIAFILISREIIISGLREFLALSKVDLPVSTLAKWKTGFQLTGVSLCFFIQSHHLLWFFKSYITFFPFSFIIPNIEVITQIVILLAVYATLHTGFVYILASKKYLK